MALSLYCASNRGAMYIELVSHLGDAANDLPFAGRISSGNFVLWSTNMASHLCKCCIFHACSSSWSPCDASYRTAHPGYRCPNASRCGQTDLRGVLESDSDSIANLSFTFFQPERKCAARSLAAADHRYSDCQHCSLLCGTVPCSGWKFSRLPDWLYGSTSLNKHPDCFLCGSSPKKWAGKIQSGI